MVTDPRRPVTDQSPRVVDVTMATEHRLLRILSHPAARRLRQLSTADRCSNTDVDVTSFHLTTMSVDGLRCILYARNDGMQYRYVA